MTLGPAESVYSQPVKPDVPVLHSGPVAYKSAFLLFTHYTYQVPFWYFWSICARDIIGCLSHSCNRKTVSFLHGSLINSFLLS